MNQLYREDYNVKQIKKLQRENIELKDLNKDLMETAEESEKACRECDQRNRNEIQDLKNFSNDLIDKCADMENTIQELKSKLENMGYLDRDTLERYLWLKFGYRYDFETIAKRDIDEAVNHICQLAIKEEAIKEEDIIDVLNRKIRHLIANEEYDNFQTQDGSMTIDEKHTAIREKTFERISDIAKEIKDKIGG